MGTQTSSYSGDDHDPQTYFTGKAAGYDRHRPTYPAESIAFVLDWLADDPTIADIGCGTGISARLLAQANPHVRIIGIDPNEDMLRTARERSRAFDERITFRVGTAEASGLEDTSVDAILCAQSFHWFDPATALREFHRITKPGGRCALMWNIRAPEDDASCAYVEIMNRTITEAERIGRAAHRNREGDPTLGGWFINPRRHHTIHWIAYDREGLLGRSRSASYFPESGPLRESFEREIGEMFDRFAKDSTVKIAHACETVVAERAD